MSAGFTIYKKGPEIRLEGHEEAGNSLEARGLGFHGWDLCGGHLLDPFPTSIWDQAPV